MTIDEEALIQANIDNLSKHDIPIVSYFGSGSSLLGSLLIKLGMDYIEGYQEQVVQASKRTKTVNPFWRERWPILNNKYATKEKDVSQRFLKAHHYPTSFKNSPISKAILLVRDGRDAALSYYNWRVGFANDKRDFDTFLKTNSYFERKPLEDWSLFCEEWFKWAQKYELHLVFFEDLKFNPYQTVKKLLDFVGVKKPPQEINDAVEETRFKKMRAQEDAVAKSDTARIFRKGLIGEWREMYSNEQLSYIRPQAQKWLDTLEYPDPEFTASKNKISIFVEKSLAPEVNSRIPLSLEHPDIQIITEPFHHKHLATAVGQVNIFYAQNSEFERSLRFLAEIENLQFIAPKNKSALFETIKALDL